MALLQSRNYPLVGAHTQIKTAVAAAGTSIDVDSTAGFAANDFILVGNPGEEGCEVVRITAITDTDTLAVGALSYAHVVDESIYFIPYDQIEFSQRTTSGGASTAITTKTMEYENGDYTNYDHPTASSSIYYVSRFYNSYTSNFSEYSDEFQIITPYCTVDDVSDYLNEPIRDDTEINYDQVEKMIIRITKEIDEETNTSWTTQTISDYEYHDGKGNRGSEYFLEYGPVISITTLETTQNDEDTDSASTTWTELTGDDDYYLDKETGRIYITNSSYNPIEGKNRFRVTYTYGRASVPNDIKRMATLMVIRDLAKMNAMKSVIRGHSEFNNNSFTAWDNEIKMLLERNTRVKQYSST